MAKNPATESHCAQGRRECEEVSSSALKPPLRSWPALSWVINPLRTPAPGRLILIKVVKTIKKRPIGHPIFQESQEIPVSQNRQF